MVRFMQIIFVSNYTKRTAARREYERTFICNEKKFCSSALYVVTYVAESNILHIAFALLYHRVTED